MSLYKSSSLAMIPTAYKDGKLYSVRPTDGSGDFTFSRGTTATRVDVNGLIEKGRENLLLHSNTFDTTWTNFNSTETSGQSGYDGSNDAWLLTKTGANGNINQVISSSGVTTFSVYAKSEASDWIFVRIGAPVLSEVYFDVSNGVVGTETNVINSNIESVGNGYYRCSVTANVSSGTYVRFYVADSDGSTSGTSGSIYIQDAQLEQGLVATDYIETGASTAQAGILEDMPRLDYSGSCPALLLEPQRTNSVTQSEYVDSWGVKTNISVVSNDGTSPEGVVNASNIYPTATGACFFYEASITYTSGTTYTYSVFAKANGKDYLQITTSGASFSNQYCTFDLALGATDNNGFESVGIEDYGNGWYRCYVVETAVSTASSRFVIGLVSNPNAGRLSSVTADGTNGILIYGVVSEAGSYPTSYIPTYGSSVTRAKEQCNVNNVSSEIGQTQGTFFLDADLYKKTNTEFYIAISDGTLTNSLYLHQASQSLLVNKRIAGVTEFLRVTSANWSSGRNKCAITYTATEMKIFINGALKDTESINGLPSGLSKFTLGSRQDNLGELASDANYKQAILFPTALTDSECIALTTL